MKVNIKKSYVNNGYVSGGRFILYDYKKLPKYHKNGTELYDIYLPDKSGFHKFYMGDSEEFYQKNLKEMPDDWHYRTKDVTYTLNSKGYRSKEFDKYDWSESIVLMGCSITFGVGVSDDETIAHYLEQITGRDVINLGVPGGSNQFMLDQSVILKQNYPKPYAVVMLWTVSDRLPYYGDNMLYHMGVWNLLEDTNEIHSNEKSKIYNTIIKNMYYDYSNEFITLKNIISANRCIWEDRTRYVETTFFDNTAHYGELFNIIPFGTDHTYKSRARDLLHPNSDAFKFGVEMIVEYLLQKYGDDIIKK